MDGVEEVWVARARGQEGEVELCTSSMPHYYLRTYHIDIYIYIFFFFVLYTGT